MVNIKKFPEIFFHYFFFIFSTMCSFEMTIPRDKNSQHSVNDNVSGYFVIISHNQIENLIHLRMQHGSSEVLRAVYAMKWPSKMLQNLPFLWKSKYVLFLNLFIWSIKSVCLLMGAFSTGLKHVWYTFWF